jgi:glutathione S-transferase
MSLVLHFHPLSSYSHKVLMALYENETPFEARSVNLGDAQARAEYLKLSPFGKIPVLRDEARDRTIIESTPIIEYLQMHAPGRVAFFPKDTDAAFEARLWDRVFDHYVHAPMQKIVGDRIRPEGVRDPHGVAEARATLKTAYDLFERRLGDHTFAAGAQFSVADCAAAPALFYAECVEPYSKSHPRLAAYFEALSQRPSYLRLIAEAKPFFRYFPYSDVIPKRFLA